MFDALNERLGKILDRIKGGGRITEAELDAALREIRLALLEADVAFKVVKRFLARIREKALGEAVLESLSPGQAVVRIVRDELVTLLGGESAGKPLDLSGPAPAVVMLAGLQGSGKTTTCGKLGLWLKSQGHSPLIAPVDLARPAAVLQAVQVARQAEVAAFEHDGSGTPVERAREAVDYARARGFDVVLLDTAGRLHVDDALMDELARIEQAVRPREILYVADGMTGQDAVRSAEAFHEKVGLTGVILTKIDGDARGGAALSVAEVTGLAIRFAGIGEKLDGLELFDPGRMAGRILGMGDVLGLIEKAEKAFDEKQARQFEQSIKSKRFTLVEFRDTLRQLRRMGPLDQLLGMIPGMRLPRGVEVDSKQLVRLEAIIDSMTPAERRDHKLLNGSRRKRIARGSGTSVPEINRLIKQFVQMQKMMKKMSRSPGRPSLGRLLGR
ncbi:MAG: signal recognition particle protein [Acidobacteriota bacterium]|nr:signal recognition particle protein [Acidobacteriota bacterium]MDQ7086817.1 signal recognition particle protein [Acidobacteriota bacterium]